jgi:preprotein translocase subunit YajC
MTATTTLTHLVFAASSSKSSGGTSLLTLLPLLAIGVLGYFFFIKPQQRKAQAARQAQSSDIQVGDEVQTVGGVIGTVLEIHGDRYTLLTGALGDDGNLGGPQPTRIVFMRAAIAKKIEPIEDVRLKDNPVDDDEPVQDIRNARGTSGNGSGAADETQPNSGEAPQGEHSGEAEEA